MSVRLRRTETFIFAEILKNAKIVLNGITFGRLFVYTVFYSFILSGEFVFPQRVFFFKLVQMHLIVLLVVAQFRLTVKQFSLVFLIIPHQRLFLRYIIQLRLYSINFCFIGIYSRCISSLTVQLLVLRLVKFFFSVICICTPVGQFILYCLYLNFNSTAFFLFRLSQLFINLKNPLFSLLFQKIFIIATFLPFLFLASKKCFYLIQPVSFPLRFFAFPRSLFRLYILNLKRILL